jgi:hypothetical protein
LSPGERQIRQVFGDQSGAEPAAGFSVDPGEWRLALRAITKRDDAESP